MKKEVEQFVKALGGTTSFSGRSWPATMFVHHPKDKQKCLDAVIKHFGRHLPFTIQTEAVAYTMQGP